MPSRALEIYCSSCGSFVARYGKKGSGALLRLYQDRILETDLILNPLRCGENLSTLKCNKCHALLGRLLKEGKRIFYQLVPGAIRKSALERKG